MVPADEQAEEIVPDPTDALEFKAVERKKPKRRALLFLMLVVVFGGGAAAGWHFFGDQLMPADTDGLPVIRAVEGPVKVRPKTPGGMEIPDRDKLVYDRMKGDVEEPRIERLLPPPEIPKTPPAPTAEMQKEMEQKVAEVAETTKSDLTQAAEGQSKMLPKPQKLEPGKVDLSKLAPKKSETETEALKKPEPNVIVNDDMMPKFVEKPKQLAPKPTLTQSVPSPGPETSETAISSVAYQIQIAAVRSEDRAKSEWDRLSKKHGDLLGGYRLNVVRADLGPDKGIFYRLRAGPIAGEDVAKALCENLAKRKVGCLIVRPGG